MTSPTRKGGGTRATEYVTFFDSVYLPQGLALHESIQRWDPGARLTVYAMDAKTHEALTTLAAPTMEVRSAWDRLPSEVRDLRGQRDWVSLLWTSTPFIIADRLKDLGVGQTLYYVDADMAFFGAPDPVEAEFKESGRDVLITAHNFAPEYDASSSVGEFAVQFIGARRDGSEDILDSWSRQCLEACPTSPTSEAFGDQKYLDSWPSDFPQRIHIASNQEWFQGPWNAVRYPASRAIAYHFHGLRIMSSNRARLTTHYRLPEPTVKALYLPYVEALARAASWLRAHGYAVSAQAPNPSIGAQIRQMAGRLRRTWQNSGGSRFLAMPASGSAEQRGPHRDG